MSSCESVCVDGRQWPCVDGVGGGETLVEFVENERKGRRNRRAELVVGKSFTDAVVYVAWECGVV